MQKISKGTTTNTEGVLLTNKEYEKLQKLTRIVEHVIQQKNEYDIRNGEML